MFGFRRLPPKIKKHRNTITAEKKRQRMADKALYQAMANNAEVKRAYVQIK